MTVLFKRKVKISIGQLEISNNKIDFEISKTSTSEPNTAVVTIINLSPDTRGNIQQLTTGVKVILEAGHLGLNPISGKVSNDEDAISIIFYGDLVQAFQFKEGPNWVTKLELGDGYEAAKAIRVSLSFEKGTLYRDAASKALNAAFKNSGVFIGDAEREIETAQVTTATNGLAIVGPGSNALKETLAPLGLEYTVVDNTVFVKRFNRPVGAPATLITKDSGLIGSPEPGKDGTIKFQAIIQKGLLPGHRIELVSAISPNGALYLIEKVKMTGGSYQNKDFTATLECKETT